MNNEELLAKLKDGLGEKMISHDESYGLLNIEVQADAAHDSIAWIKENELQMQFLTDLCAVHYPEQKDREIAVVYHLHNLITNTRLRVKAFIPISNPEIKSITDLFAGANWMERETFDFYGVQFTGHPDLRRILNMDSMDYYPLRKEYALEDETRTDKTDKYFGR